MVDTPLSETCGLVAAIDQRLSTLCRQGLIPPHQACDGEEAVLVGSAAAMQAGDWIFWGRQVLVPALLRGLPADRIFSHAFDMSAAAEIAQLQIVSMTSGPAARLPHAAGLAWAGRKDGVVALCELGDGAVSDADFHVGLNFAGVLGAPLVCVVRSEDPEAPVFERGEGYGIEALRIAGDDPEVVREAVAAAAERARGGGGPTLIEAVVQRGRQLPKSQIARHEDAAGAALAVAERRRK